MPKQPERIRLESGEELAEKYRLHGWDFIIAGDGSGTSWENSIGFGSILYCRNNGVRRRFFGGLSNGTSNVAEMMAVVLPLLYIESDVNFKHGIPNVYIISDSLYVVNTGNGEYALKTNRALWETVNHLRTRLNLNFVYEKRMLLPANVFGDQIGNTIRMDFQQFTYQLDTLYFVNPNEKNNDSK